MRQTDDADNNDNDSEQQNQQSTRTQTATNTKMELLQSEIDLRLNLKRQMQGKGDRKMINEVCPDCNAPQMAYHTRQLRSVDEGQTIFYECLECGHKSVLHS